MRNFRSYTCTGLALCLLAISTFDLCSAPAPLQLLSAKDTQVATDVSGNGNSFSSAFTADGSKFFFISQANNLTTNDHNGIQYDVFVRDLANGTTRLVSVNHAGTVSANGMSDFPVASSNGTRFAFISAGTDFGSADTNGTYDIIWRDLDANITKLLSVGTGGAGNNLSIKPSISADGRWVTFESRASNLVNHDTNGSSDIFLRDTETDVTILVSANTNGLGSAQGDSQNAIISANGKKVAYVSRVTGGTNDLANNTNNHSSDLHVFDVETSQNHMVKLSQTNTSDSALNVSTYNHVLSADGRYLAFQANHTSTNQIEAGVYWVDLETDTAISFDQKWHERLAQLDPPVTASIVTTNILSLPDLSGPSMNADGQVLTFEASYQSGTQVLRDVWVWWPGTNGIRRLTNSVSESVTNQNLSPSISADGRYVVAHSTEVGLFVTDLNDFSVKEGLGSDDLPGAVLSPDGSQLAFQTRTDGLVTNENNKFYDVFIRSLADNKLTLVSTHAENMEAVTGFGWTGFVPRGLTDDGRYVIFTSSAALTTNDHNSGMMDVFVRDLEAGSTELISVNATGNQSGNGNSFNPSISADGRYVVFESFATNLVETNTYYRQKIFLRDRETGLTRMLTHPPSNSALNNSHNSAISADGRYVVFQSHLTNLATNDLGSDRDTFLYEISTGNRSLLSTTIPIGVSSDRYPMAPAISGDGQRIIFWERLSSPSSNARAYLYDLSVSNLSTIATNSAFLYPSSASSQVLINRHGTKGYVFGLQNLDILVYDVANRSTEMIVGTPGDGNKPERNRLAVSADGRYLAYSTHGSLSPLDLNSTNDVYVHNFVTHSNILVSINKDASGAGSGVSENVSISLDGRFVAFQSTANNLVAGDDNNASDIFVRDLALNTTTRVSSGSGPHSRPLISADGRVIVFSSGGNKAAFSDFNNSTDAYAVRLTIDNGSTDSDEDGMSDVWEFSMFGDLSRDGTGDADQDGLSDLNEFRAGTHPLDDQSTFAGQILTPAGNGSVSISWTMAAEKAYRVEYRNSLTEGEWVLLEGTYAVEGNTATQTDIPPAGTEQRYYRIVIVTAP